ncbi:hypothetical protein [Streptomyces gardneri]|uniref:hypothetical protein n=1 Tax=Streptomyces gardneri TaxID=66892 RepID=UPI00368B252C
MNPLRDAHLTTDQRELLRYIAEPWIRTGQWHLWGTVQHHFDRRNLDAETLLRSLPRVGTSTPYAAGYGYTTGIPRQLAEHDCIRLTIASCLVLDEMTEAASKPFNITLKVMEQSYLAPRPNQPGTTTDRFLRSRTLLNPRPTKLRPGPLHPRFVDALPELLSYEPAIASGNKITAPDGSWKLKITRSVLEYRGVRSITEYVDKTCQIVTANAAQHTNYAVVGDAHPVSVGSPAHDMPLTGTNVKATVPIAERPPYLDTTLLTELEEAAHGTKWKVHKLLALCDELNSNYATGNAYACAALIRAITDHIPPVFGHRDFKQVAAQHTFTVQRTDKAHAQKLVAFKDIADDALHRPISPNLPLVTMNDLPEPTRLRAVLHELASVLRQPERS